MIGGLGEVIFVFRYDEAEEDPIFMGGDYGFSLRKTSFFFSALKRILGVWVCGCLCAVCMLCPQKPEEGGGSLGIRVTDSCEQT